MVKRLLFLTALSTGCLEHAVRPCDDGTVCEIGQVCLESGGCAFEAFRDACTGLDEMTACTAVDPVTDKTIAGMCLSGACFVGVCGDAIITPPEVCDDGNTNGTDSCAADCSFVNGCGNSIVEGAEECDDGNQIAGDGCNPGCLLPACGDLMVDPGEACDLGPSGNQDNPDAMCRKDCQLRRCGDGIIDPMAGEVCDDGNTEDGDDCSADCLTDTTP